MQAFFEWTAWPMPEPERYGLFHIVLTLLLLGLTVLAAWLLRHTNDKQNRIVLAVVGGFLLLTEVYKIGFHLTVNPYDWGFWGAFPFQLCSLPMYLCLICAICPSHKVNAWLYEAMFAINMFGGLISFCEPSGIQHPFVVLTLHAYVWHMSLIFVGLYLYMSKRVCTDAKSYWKGEAVYLAACGVAQGFNLLFGDKVNCFYISPYVQSPLAVFKDIWASCGWLVNAFLMLLGMSLAAAAVYYIGYGFRRLAQKKK